MTTGRIFVGLFQCSSASRKFLNHIVTGAAYKTTRFQCSSASRKFLNRYRDNDAQALLSLFQCSSASRKFLNPRRPFARSLWNAFQCSSASRKFLNPKNRKCVFRDEDVSVLFSEPKIPQYFAGNPANFPLDNVSVLFSEPKIPQSYVHVFPSLGGVKFQCSSASRKFLNDAPLPLIAVAARVSVLFSEPKIPQYFRQHRRRALQRVVSVLFSEPKIPQCGEPNLLNIPRGEFQCSSASRKFLNQHSKRGICQYLDRFSALQRAENSSIRLGRSNTASESAVSVLFSEPKIPQCAG